MVSVLGAALGCLLVANIAGADTPCEPLDAEYGTVCVCNSTYCDTVGALPELEDGEYALIITSESGQRFNVTTGTTTLSHIPHDMVNGVISSVVTTLSTFPQLTWISIDPRITYQEMEGFGGTFTDASGINILNISSEAQENLLKSYFGTDGLDYNMGRVPIGGCDHSSHPYAYNEYPINDTNLVNFTLSEEDYTLKIPLIKRAQELATDVIRLQGATWSPPLWMKTSDSYNGYGQLLTEFYHTYALYHLKFLQEYNKSNVTIESLSTGNQPIIEALGDVLNGNSLGWVPENQARWIMNHFGPVIKGSEFPDTKIYVLDEQTPFVNDMLPTLLQNDTIRKYIDGVAIHWYVDVASNIADIDKVYDLLGNISIINTEASAGALPTDSGIKLGKWSRAEEYLYYLIEKVNHFVSGWLDWNLAVDLEGGPAWNNGSIDAFVVVDAANDQFFKTPMYYAFGHMSKYVPRGSVRIASYTVNTLYNVCFKRPDGLMTVVALNNGTSDLTVSIDDVSTAQFIKFTLEAHAMATVVYKPKNLVQSPIV